MKNDPRSCERMQLRKKPAEKESLNGIWTRDLAIPVRCSNQLSYEATDVGSWLQLCVHMFTKRNIKLNLIADGMTRIEYSIFL